MAGGMSQVVEHLPSKARSPVKKKKEEEEEEGGGGGRGREGEKEEERKERENSKCLSSGIFIQLITI
jgi:ribosomal protein L12E/L44/L45/RPP1/RPP2